MLLNTPYSQSEIASLNGLMSLNPTGVWRMLKIRKNLHVLRLVDPFLFPVVARRNFLVMREVSVVTSWMDPKLIVDLFFGLPQLGWAMPAPTMQLREAPPENPIEALRADCGDHNSKLISRCRPSGNDKLDNAAWEKTEEELSSEMIIGPFFRPSRRPVP